MSRHGDRHFDAERAVEREAEFIYSKAAALVHNDHAMWEKPIKLVPGRYAIRDLRKRNQGALQWPTRSRKRALS